MVRTLAIFIVLIGITLLFLPRNHHDPIKPVDYETELSIFARAASFKPVAPTPLPTKWTVTSFSGTARGAASSFSTMNMGIVTKGERYVELRESDEAQDALLDRFLGDKRTEAGIQSIDGESWRKTISAKGVPALWRSEGAATFLVFGGATTKGAGTADEIAALVATLETVGAPSAG